MFQLPLTPGKIFTDMSPHPLILCTVTARSVMTFTSVCGDDWLRELVINDVAFCKGRDSA